MRFLTTSYADYELELICDYLLGFLSSTQPTCYATPPPPGNWPEVPIIDKDWHPYGERG